MAASVFIVPNNCTNIGVCEKNVLFPHILYGYIKYTAASIYFSLKPVVPVLQQEIGGRERILQLFRIAIEKK